MLKGYNLLVVILILLLLLFFVSFENKLVELGLSWTFSKAFPYTLLLFFGFLFSRIIYKQFKLKNKIFKFSLTSISFVLPFLIGFILHPIYEGDFSLQGEIIKERKNQVAISNTDLLVITIPNCPFCLGSIEKLKKIKKRNPSVKITFVVCSSAKDDIIEYKKIIGNSFSIKMASDIEQMITLSDSKFPSFIQIEKGLTKYKWSNDQFGVRAIDKFEKTIN